MMTFIAVCIGILTLVHVAAFCLLIVALSNLNRASQAVESLAYRAQDQLSNVEGAVQKVRDFAQWTSGWPKILSVLFGAGAAAWSRRKGSSQSSRD